MRAWDGSVNESPGRRSAPDVIFRFRYGLHVLTYATAFFLSWADPLHLGARRVWLDLPLTMSNVLHLDLQTAIVTLTAAATLLAFAAAWLRTWATAYLGSQTVFDASLRGDRINAAGPYRYLRNPLYVGTVLHTLALSVLMTWSGAVFCIVVIVAMQVALVMAEERFWQAAGDPAYGRYAARVPRVLPRFRAGIEGSSRVKARWPQALAGEVYLWGVAISFAALGFTYNAVLVLQGVVVSFGLSIAVRGLLRER